MAEEPKNEDTEEKMSDREWHDLAIAQSPAFEMFAPVLAADGGPAALAYAARTAFNGEIGLDDFLRHARDIYVRVTELKGDVPESDKKVRTTRVQSVPLDAVMSAQAEVPFSLGAQQPEDGDDCECLLCTLRRSMQAKQRAQAGGLH